MKVYTPDELAELLNLDVEKLHDLRQRHHWPHVRLSRFEYRFTEDQVRQILADRSTGTTTKVDPMRVKVPGQTARSAARRRSA